MAHGDQQLSLKAWRSVLYRADRASLSSAAFFAIIFVPLVMLYLATAKWTAPYGVDATTNALTAWELATEGDVYLEDQIDLLDPLFRGRGAWVVPAANGSGVSQYPPGAAVLAVPLYAMWPDRDIQQWIGTVGANQATFSTPPIGPAAITASTVVAAGVGMLGLAIRPLAGARVAIAAAYVGGLATGVWSVAADRLWLHSADVGYLGAGLWLSARRPLSSGLAFGLAVLTRPHSVVVGAGVGLGRAWDARQWRPIVLTGIGLGLGMAALLGYNAAIFGTPSIGGGYGIGATEVLTAGRVDFLPNVVGAMLDPRRGLMIYSPFLIAMLPGIPAAWHNAPGWVRGSAVGGLAYLVVQLAANRFSGGGGFFGYRYPIEALVAAAPLLALTYVHWISKTRNRTRLFVTLVAASVTIHLIGAIGCVGELC